MTGEDQSNESTQDENRESPASAIFVAMMRQAAAKAAPNRGTSDAAADIADVADDPRSESLAESEEKHQIHRVRPRLVLRRPPANSMASGFLGTIFVVVVVTGLIATLLMFFVNPEFLNPAVVRGLNVDTQDIFGGIAAAPTPVQTPQWLKRIGIISGHRGKDSGATCEDEYGNTLIREVDINFAVAEIVVSRLKAENYSVDLLDENDPRLDNYRAAALVSIHANTCFDFGEYVTGFIVAIAEARPDVGVDAFLRECVGVNYDVYVPLERSYNLTENMTNYHVWQKIHPLTPGAILEMGYMLADHDVLTEDPELLAHAIVAGIHCFLDNADASLVRAVPVNRGVDYLVPIFATPTPTFR